MNEATGSGFWSGMSSAVISAAVTAATNAVPTSPASSATLKVNHDNVLAAAKIIQAQVDALKDSVDANAPSLQVEAAAQDPVSRDAARAWNYRLVGADDSYKARIDDYLVSLQKLVVQLQESARAYGFSDSDIAAAFGTRID